MPRRIRWSLRGAMVAVAVAAVLLVALRWSLPKWSVSHRNWLQTSQIQAELDRVVPLADPDGFPLGEPHELLVQATTTANLPRGIPIYVDPEGLHDVAKTMASLISFDGRNVPLGQDLHSALQKYGLDYFFEDGLITMTSTSRRAR